MWWLAGGIGLWWLLTRKPAQQTVLGTVSPPPMTNTIYDQLIQAAQRKYPNVTNVQASEWGDGSMTFTGQALASDGKSWVTIKLFDATGADDALAKTR